MAIEPEMRLLLACAAPGEAPLPPLEHLDWGRLALLAERHRMVMLVGRRLLGRAVLPEPQEAWLAEEMRAGAARALSMAAELARITAGLEEAGVTVAAYKGPSLSVRAYGDAGLRWCSDLDVLVEPARVPAALKRLRELGYAQLREDTGARETVFREMDGDYPLRGEASGTLLELHAHVSPPRFAPRFATPRLLDRRVQVRIGPFRVPDLSDEDLLLALAVHGAKHRWARLEWLAGFGGLLTRTGWEPPRLVEAGTAIGAGRAVRVALELCRRLLDLPLPRERDRAAVTLAAAAAARLLGDQPRHDARDTADNLRFNLALCDTPADRLRTTWRWLTLPTAEDWAWRPLPDRLFPAYRVLRPARLLARYGPRALRREPGA